MWAAENLGYSELAGIGQATPTAELEPLREGQAPQTDEQVMLSLLDYEVGCKIMCTTMSMIGPRNLQISAQTAEFWTS